MNQLKKAFLILMSQVAFAVSNLYVSSRIENLWGDEGFGEYSVYKRLISFVVFPLMFGVGISLPRKISISSDSQEKRFLFSGTLLFIITFTFLNIIVLLIPNALSVFGIAKQDSSKIHLILSANIFVQGLFSILFSYYKGLLKINIAAFLHALVMSLIPLLCLYFVFDNQGYFLYVGIISLIVLGVFYGYIYGYGGILLNKKNIIQDFKDYIKFGLPRIPSEFALFGMSAIPVFVINYYYGFEMAGVSSLAILFFKLFTLPFESINSFLLPFLGNILKTQGMKRVLEKISLYQIVNAIVSILGSLLLWFIFQYILQVLFPSFMKYASLIELTIFSYPLANVYYLLRNVFDLLFSKAYTSIILLTSFSIQIILLGIGVYLNNHTILISYTIIVPNICMGVIAYYIWYSKRKQLHEQHKTSTNINS